ncbi:MAG: hypothetical protein QM754_14435 [Tepidisphaeraceae bacterium]
MVWQLARHAIFVVVRPPATRPAYVVAPPGTIPDPPPQQPEVRFGEAGGTGQAINSSPGEKPQTATESNPDQAAWTRDPTGKGPIQEPIPESTPKPLQQAVVTPPPTALPTPPESKAPSFRKPPPPQPKAPVAEVSRPTPQQQSQQQPQQRPQESGGTPMPHSDQDSDPFAKEVTLEFTAGGVTASDGRQIKFKKPRINMAGFVEAGEISFPARLRLRVRVKPDGNPGRVTIVQSTGSRSLDRAFELSAYESWFEPRKNKAGQAVEDEFEFNIVLK